ncbi:MAG: baseplate assembly protein [Rhizobiales bacterium]|nr:baseplate assembly protein [Hyphomicrobiales bacterium]
MRSGVNQRTGTWLEGFEHCVQSIGMILRTRLASRPWARDFGSRVPDLQDQNAANRFLIEFARDTVEALEADEPGFVVSEFRLDEGGRDGRFVFIIVGLFYPRGHLGDYSLTESREIAVSGQGRDLSGLEAVAA